MRNQFEDYYSTLKISNKEGYQLLLSSQLYGTNFSVFCKFTFEKKNPSSIKKMDLKIFNYKGILDLGFSVKHPPTIHEKHDGKYKYLMINFSLRAMAGNPPSPNEKEVIMHQVYIPDNPIKNDEYKIKSQRSLIPISGDINESPITNGVFDTEFYYRDGAKYIRKIVREIPTDDEILTYPIRVEDIPGSIFPEATPGMICRQGILHSKFS